MVKTKNNNSIYAQNKAILLIIGAYISGSVPPILRVAKAKHLCYSNNERKIYTGIVPPLGGIAIFIGFVLSSSIATDGLSFDSFKFIIASVIVMFFIGLNNHVHHRLFTLSGNHLKVTIIIVFTNVCIVLFALLLNHNIASVNRQLLIIFLIGMALSFVPYVLLNLKLKRVKHKIIWQNNFIKAQSIKVKYAI